MATKKKMLQAAAGNAGGAAALNVEDVFSTYLYEGNNTNPRTITNGIDLDGEGGMVWIKRRTATDWHTLSDTERGTDSRLSSNSTNAAGSGVVTAFNSDGFNVNDSGQVNFSGDYASWTFRKAPKFFDVVTYTGDGTNNRKISHNLGSVPGCYIVKQTNDGRSWNIYHRGSNGGSSPEDFVLVFDTDAQADADYWNDTAPTATEFTINNYVPLNESGGNYVAYLFAHNDGDGEFGPDGDADIIKCGSYTGNGNTDGPDIDLGFEPQFLIVKATDRSSNWYLWDTMRGLTVASSPNAPVYPNQNNAEYIGTTYVAPTSTGFNVTDSANDVNRSGENYIYIAIRRGPMAVPESATDVFEPITWSYSSNGEYTLSNLDYMDTFWHKRLDSSQDHMRYDRLRGTTARFRTDAAQEISDTNSWDTLWDNMNKFKYVSSAGSEWQGNQIGWAWKRAPNYFDVVAYTGNSTAGRTVNHNLGVAPEMMCVKKRNDGGYWRIYHKGLNGGTNPEQYGLNLNETVAEYDDNLLWNDTAPTASVFSLGTQGNVNFSGSTYIAYLFATLAGISKVGSVTHSGTTNVDCGFTSGARFVLLKRTDATGDWYVWDSERGIVAGNDPYLLLNSTAAEVTSTDYIDPLSSGFTITSSFTAGDYIFYAIA